MSSFLVSMPPGTPANGLPTYNGVTFMYIWADSLAQAHQIANGLFSDPDGLWNAANYTTLTVPEDFRGWGMRIQIQPTGTNFVFFPNANIRSVGQTMSLVGAGTGYNIGDLVQLEEGTGVIQKAVVEVTAVSGGDPTSVRVVTPGMYLTLPPAGAATTAITGGGGDEVVAQNHIHLNEADGVVLEQNMMNQLARALNTLPEIDGAAVDATGGAGDNMLVTVADAADNIGDNTLTPTWLYGGVGPNESDDTYLIAVTHEGAAGAALTFEVDDPNFTASAASLMSNLGEKPPAPPNPPHVFTLDDEGNLAKIDYTGRVIRVG